MSSRAAPRRRPSTWSEPGPATVTRAAAQDTRAETGASADTNMNTWGWLLPFVRPHAGGLALVLALSLLATGLGLVQPLLTRLLIDDGLIRANPRVVVWVAAAMVALAIASAALGGLNRWLYTGLSGRVLFAMREAVFRHLERLSPDFFARRGSGDLMARLDGDVAEIQRFATDSLLASVNAAITLAGSLAIMLALSWKLTLIALIFLPAQIAVLRALRPRIERLTRVVRERAGDVTGFFVETLGAMKFIQSTAAEDRMATRLAGLHGDYLDGLLKAQMAGYLAGAVPAVLMTLGVAAMFIAGGYMVAERTISVGTLIAFSIYLGRAGAPVRTFMGLYVAVRRARVSLSRVLELMREVPEITVPASARSLPADTPGAIRFEHVRVARRGREGPVLDDLSLDIPAGAKVVITGPSGAGKSTLIDLLHRHLDPDAGRVLLDGADVRELDLVTLRRRIAVVAQDAGMLSGTVADAIRFGNWDAGDADIARAAARAEIADFIESLPDGYETRLAERGVDLSGGQRQRLAIARAILQDPAVLVLDEATSAIDREAEARILETIDRVFAGRTRIIISHRPAPMVAEAMVYRLSGGRLTALDAPDAGEGME